MRKLRYAVIKTGVRTWQIAEYETLDTLPLFQLRKQRFHSEFQALEAATKAQADYDACDCKVVHDLAIVPAECSPKRTRDGKTVVELAERGQL